MSTRKIIGLVLVVGPFVGILLLLAAYAITGYTLSSIAEAEAAAPVELAVDLEHGLEDVSERDLSGSEFVAVEEAGLGEADFSSTIGGLINLMLGFLGIVFVLGIIVGVPTGIYLLVTPGKDKKKKK